MSKNYRTDQETFWAGEFGDTYVERNNDARRIAKRTALFAKILARTRNVSRVLELGANIGQNILAIRNLLPDATFGAVEINEKALEILGRISNTKVFPGSILDFDIVQAGQYDLTLTSGVLIHIDPDHLADIYERLYGCSTSYIALMEYYNPTPVEVTYRGHAKRLFKRDFAGEMLARYPDLELIDYGFQYHGDYNFPADDGTWFLLKKTEH